MCLTKIKNYGDISLIIYRKKIRFNYICLNPLVKKELGMQPMYKKLLQLPLFQGLSQKELTEIIEKVVFQFASKQADILLAQQGQDCNSLFYILDGKISKKTISSDKTYIVEQVLEAPSIIEPQSLFGKDTEYQSSYTSLSPIDIITIDKRFVLADLMNYPIFELNYINILSCISQNQYKLLWNHKTCNELADRFKCFIRQRTEPTCSEITLHITMKDLAFQLNDTRFNVSRMLNMLEEQSKVCLKRKIVQIKNLELL